MDDIIDKCRKKLADDTAISKIVKSPYFSEQVALLSQRGRAMLRVCQINLLSYNSYNTIPDGEKSLKIRLFVSSEYTNVTVRQTNGHRMTA